MRANAAIRLAEMAQQRYPGKSDRKEPESYPYFSRAASQLATTLRMEEDAQVRRETVEALRQMTEFAAEAEKQILLYKLIGFLADTNREAREAFSVILSEHAFAMKRPQDNGEETGDPDDPKHTTDPLFDIVHLTPFCIGKENVEEINWWCLKTLMATDKAQARWRVLNTYNADNANASQQRDLSAERTKMRQQIEHQAACLITTRNALTNALKGLKGHQYPELNLRSVFLSGVDLTKAHLAKAKLQKSWLQGTTLHSANLEDADFYQSHLHYADLFQSSVTRTKFNHISAYHARFDEIKGADCTFEGANMPDAKFKSARLAKPIFSNTKMATADLSAAKLQGAKLDRCSIPFGNLDHVDLSDANIEKAELREISIQQADVRNAQAQGANFDGAIIRGCKVYGLQYKSVGETTMGDNSLTSFKEVNWREADFEHYEVSSKGQFTKTGKEDEGFKQWLQQKFPRPEESNDED